MGIYKELLSLKENISTLNSESNDIIKLDFHTM